MNELDIHLFSLLKKGEQLLLARKLKQGKEIVSTVLETATSPSVLYQEALLLKIKFLIIESAYTSNDGLLNSARKQLDQLRTQYEEVKSPSINALNLVEGDWYQTAKKFKQAEVFYLKIIENPAKDDLYKGLTYARLSKLFLEQSRFDQALAFGKKCDELAQETQFDILHLKSKIAIGYVYARRHQYSEILEYFEEGLRLSQSLGDVESEIFCLSNIGIAHSSRHHLKLALKSLLLALEKSELINFKLSAVKCLVNISTIFYILYNHEEALLRFHRILNDYEYLLDINTLTVLYYNLGDTYAQKGELEQAHHYFKKCIKAGDESGYREVKALGLTQIARNFVRRNLPEKALTFANEAMALYQDLGGGKEGIHITLITLGQIFYQKNDLEKSLFYIQQGMDLAIEIQSNEEQAIGYQMWSTIAKDQGDYEKAYNHYVEFSKRQNLLAQKQKDYQLMDMEIKYETREKEKEIELLKKTKEQREAAFKEKISRFKMQALQAQMNPHFIFNSMNAIQQFIVTNDNEAAMNYLSKFARLIRLIFEYSQKTQITLRQEINFLSLYLHLENLRFKNKIEAGVHVEPNIPLDQIELPPLLIQPLIENAFKHGLMHRPQGGKIDIRFSLNKQVLTCTIEDNGVGRVAAAKLNSWRPEEYRSSGIKITEERLNLINARQEPESIDHQQMIITDLVDHNNQALGTRIELILKLSL